MSYCPSCGTPIGAGDRFCAGCGAAVEGPSSPAPPPGEPAAVAPAAARPAAGIPWYRTNTGILGIGMVLAAAATVVVVLLVGGGGDGGTVAGGTDTSAATQPTQPPATSTTTTSTTPATTTTTTTQPPAGFDPAQSAAFLEACEGADFSTGECTCWLEGLEAAGMTNDQLGEALMSDEVSDEINTLLTDALFACVDTTTPDLGFTDAFRDAFIADCRGGGNLAFCNCSIDAFEAVYPQQELQAILDRTVEPPAGFTETALTCLPELRYTAPLPIFVLPYACGIDQWGATVTYPSGWVDNGACDGFAPEGWDPDAPTPITVFVDDTSAVSDYVGFLGQPEEHELADRTLLVWSWVTEDQSEATSFMIPLWPDVPDGPLMTVSAWESSGYDYATARLIAEAMIRDMDIAPYAP